MTAAAVRILNFIYFVTQLVFAINEVVSLLDLID
jgi:hypothetical protein